MKPKNCLIFGASGQIGRNLIRRLTEKNLKVTAVTRNSHQKGYILKTQANPGYLDIVESNIFDEQKKIMKREQSKLNDLLTIPVADRPNWSVDEINKEITNSAQTLLGYVVRLSLIHI